QATGAPLDFPVSVLGRDVVDDAPPHRPYVRHRLRALGRLPDQRLQGGEPLIAELAVTGRRSSLQQCLKLPRAGPFLVVGEVRGEGAHERPAGAFRAQVGVDWPRGLAAYLDEPSGDDLGLGDVLVPATH